MSDNKQLIRMNINFKEVLIQIKTDIFIQENTTLHLEQEIPNETDTHPFRVWVLTFFHPPLLSTPLLAVLVVKTHNLEAVAVFLLSVLLITCLKILLPWPRTLILGDVYHLQDQNMSQNYSNRSYLGPVIQWRIGRKSVFHSWFIFDSTSSEAKFCC